MCWVSRDQIVEIDHRNECSVKPPKCSAVNPFVGLNESPLVSWTPPIYG